MPREYPLAFFEMSYLLPHFLKEGRGKLAMYFTRVYNPVWTNPDGMSWVEMLTDEAKIERHACLTPIWSETAWFADFVLPMGHASERHDLMSQETHAARWIGFRQPVLRVMLERQGRTFDFTWQAHEAVGLGQVWEEDEFWIELSWRIDPDGSLGVRKYFESPYRPGQKLRAEEVYRWIFERSVPGLPAAAARAGLPTRVETSSGNSKALYEISHTDPLGLHPEDAARLGVTTGDLLRVTTAIGHFVDRAWVTEAIRPGVIACSHHLGRWRLHPDAGGERWSSALVELQQVERGKWRMRQLEGVRPFVSDDPDSARVWWQDAGVHQNLTFPVQPDPVSGQHCWHQKVTVARPGPDDRYGDVVVDTNRSFEVYREWLRLARPAPGPGNLRRPLWLPRALKPDPSAYLL